MVSGGFGYCVEISGDVRIPVRCRSVFHKNFNNYILEFLVKEMEKGRQDDHVGGRFIYIWVTSPRGGCLFSACWNTWLKPLIRA